METFQHSNEVVLDIRNFLTVCTTLPALQEGRVIGSFDFSFILLLGNIFVFLKDLFSSFVGYSKMLPSEQCLDKFMELCLFKVTHYFP